MSACGPFEEERAGEIRFPTCFDSGSFPSTFSPAASRKTAHFAPGVVDDGKSSGGGGGGIGGMFGSPKKRGLSIIGSTNCGGGGGASTSSVDGLMSPVNVNNVVKRRDKSKLAIANGGGGGGGQHKNAAPAEPQKKKGNFKSIVHSRSISSLLRPLTRSTPISRDRLSLFLVFGGNAPRSRKCTRNAASTRRLFFARDVDGFMYNVAEPLSKLSSLLRGSAGHGIIQDPTSV